MTEVHYSRAPILEAIIDIQTRFRTAPEQALFLEMAQRLAPRFPQSNQLTQIGIGVGVGPGIGIQHIPSVVQHGGLRLSTPQNDRVLLLQPSGLRFSHMPPYTEWQTFRDEAVKLWKQFVALVKPEAVTRTALRYINRFEIPRPNFDLSDYFALRPETPSTGIPQSISAFFMQCQLPQLDLGSDVTAIVNLGSAGSTPGGAQQILLDFDVFAMRQIAPESDAVVDLLDRLRTRKNELFEACITDRARELIR